MRPEDAAAAAAAGASAVSFILVPGRRRTLTLDEALRVRQAIPSSLVAVAVVAPQPPTAAARLAAALELDALQLHGSWTEEAAGLVRRRVRVLRTWDLEAPPPTEADWLLADLGAGGTGQSWDWRRVRGVGRDVPLILAGGLTPDNVALALDQAEPDGVDVSSGVESEGVKDPLKIRRFCEAAWGWAHERSAGGS